MSAHAGVTFQRLVSTSITQRRYDQAMLSSFQLRKLVLGYYRWDTTKDGLVRASDFEELGRRVAGSLGVDSGSDQYESILNGYRGVWAAYWQGLDADGDNAVTLQEVLAAAEGGLDPSAVNVEEVAAFAKQTNLRLVGALDANGDGELEPEEYTAFVGALGVSEENAAKAFGKLDSNGDGKLSAEEIAVAWGEYYASDDPSATSNWFYGEF